MKLKQVYVPKPPICDFVYFLFVLISHFREREEEEGIEAARSRKMEEEKTEEERKKKEKIQEMRRAAQLKREAVSD